MRLGLTDARVVRRSKRTRKGAFPAEMNAIVPSQRLLAAIAPNYPAATSGRCRWHFLRNALAHVRRRQHQVVAAAIRTAFVQGDAAQAHGQWREVADKLRRRFPELSSLMDEAEDDVLTFMAFPKEYGPQLASTNSLERRNKEIKRRSRVVGILPNGAAIVRLMDTLLAEQTGEWQVRRRYLSQESLARVISPDSARALIEEQQAA